ncbi:MAG: DNA-3-methyladenine glycosylase [Bacteriovoracaceae bacterium]|nr:DNA-3-methyladenine glycosylase [Bacteriovoracaceae bacterium]
MSQKLKRSFFQNGSVENLAPRLLGKILYTQIGNEICAGKIIEVEAYCGRRDKACHAFFKKTERNKIMFTDGGVFYVYLCYGIHKLLNIVTGPPDDPSGIMIRSIEPIVGIDTMMFRRNVDRLTPNMTNGPGKLSQALGIELSHYGEGIDGDTIWIEHGERVKEHEILVGKRIGIDYAGEDKNLPWRFALDSKFVGYKKLLTNR